MKTIEKVLDVITITVVVIAVVLFLPFVFNVRPYIVMTGSMEPQLPRWSLAYVDRSVKPDDMEEGDVIAYLVSGNTVTHRIIGEAGDDFITKGDANRQADETPTPKDKVVGLVIYSIPYIGYVIHLMRTVYGVAFILLIGAGYVAVAVLSDKNNTEEKEKNYDTEEDESERDGSERDESEGECTPQTC